MARAHTSQAEQWHSTLPATSETKRARLKESPVRDSAPRQLTLRGRGRADQHGEGHIHWHMGAARYGSFTSWRCADGNRSALVDADKLGDLSAVN